MKRAERVDFSSAERLDGETDGEYQKQRQSLRYCFSGYPDLSVVFRSEQRSKAISRILTFPFQLCMAIINSDCLVGD